MTRELQKILLVYPEIPSNTYWSFKYALKFVRKKSAMPPLGLITVAALLPETTQLKLVDMNVESLKEKDIEWADAVFISAMIVQKKSFDTVVELCNRFNTPIIAGGPHVTVSYKEIKGVDHLLLGEVEETLSGFLDDYEHGVAKSIYPSPCRPDITNSVLPRFDLLKIKAYASMSIQYSRGCPFNCEFCDIWQIYGRKPRVKNSDNMVVELDRLKAMGWQGAVFVVDDNFIGNKKTVKENLLPAFTRWQTQHKNPFRFYTEASLNLADDEALLAGMRDAGFNSVFLGIETPSEKSLQETGKMQNVNSDMPRAIKKIQSFGIEVMGGFILGFDNDSEETFLSQIKFIQKTAIPKAMIGLLSAVPGTELYKRLMKEKRILSDEISGSNTHSLETNFVTRMNPKILKEGYRKVLDTLYGMNLKNYFQRCNQLLDSLGESPFFQREIHLAEIGMFINSFVFQSCSRYGYQYLKFIARNFIKHKNRFGEAVRMSIEGHHLYVITREMLKVDNLSSLLEERYRAIADKVNACSMAFSNDSNKRAKEIVRLWKSKQAVLRMVRRKVYRVNADFREELIQKYREIDEKLKAVFSKYKDELIQYDERIVFDL